MALDEVRLEFQGARSFFERCIEPLVQAAYAHSRGAMDNSAEHDGGGIDEHQAQMNSHVRLAEYRHQAGICCINTRKLHVVKLLIGQHPLQNQLSAIGILALIPFQWNADQSIADDHREQNNKQQPPECNPPICHSRLAIAIGWVLYYHFFDNDFREVKNFAVQGLTDLSRFEN